MYTRTKVSSRSDRMNDKISTEGIKLISIAETREVFSTPKEQVTFSSAQMSRS